MKTAKQTSGFLQNALLSIPDDFALSEVKFHIKTAIYKLESLEKKREQREINGQKRKDERKAALILNPLSPQQTLQTLDDMIQQEKYKLEELKNNKIQKNERDDDEQLLG